LFVVINKQTQCYEVSSKGWGDKSGLVLRVQHQEKVNEYIAESISVKLQYR